MENLRDLNKIVQKKDYKTKGNWMVRTFLRDAALPCTWLLLHTQISANQVTLVALVVGLLSAVFFALPGTAAFVLACLLLQLWYYLDHVDGQIARYRKTACITGRFFDFLMHHIIHGAVLFALGFYWGLRLDYSFYYFWAFVTSSGMCLFNMMHDIKSKAFIEKLLQGTAWKTVNADAAHNFSARIEHKVSIQKMTFSVLHKLCEIHVFMNIVTALAVISLIWGGEANIRFCLFWFYGLVIPFITVVKLSFVILGRKIDHEFDEHFKET